MIVMFLVWKLVKRTKFVRRSEMDLLTDRYNVVPQDGLDPNANMNVNAEYESQQPTSRREKILASIKGEEKGVWAKVKRVGMWLFL